MLKSHSIVKFYSIFFLILMVYSLIGSSSRFFVKKETGNKQEITAKMDGSQNEKDQNSDASDSKDTEKLVESPFNAVVNAGLQWDFHKQFCLIPTFIEFFTPQKINVTSYEISIPLPYFIILFHTSICVNAP